MRLNVFLSSARKEVDVSFLAKILFNVRKENFILFNLPKRTSLSIKGSVLAALVIGPLLVASNDAPEIVESAPSALFVNRVQDAASRSFEREPLTFSKVQIVNDDSSEIILSNKSSLKEALIDNDFVLEDNQSLNVSLDTALTEDETLVVTVETLTDEILTVEESVPFASTRVEDASLLKGVEEITQAGVEGKTSATYRVTSNQEDVEISREIIAKSAPVAPVEEIIKVGVKEPVVEKPKPVAPPVNTDASNTPVPGPAVSVDPGSSRAIAKDMVLARNWSESEFQCLDSLWQKESNWNSTAENRSSGAYGIPQSLPGSKMASVGDDWRTNPATQITWGLNYIEGRYGTPCGAWQHSKNKGWY